MVVHTKWICLSGKEEKLKLISVLRIFMKIRVSQSYVFLVSLQFKINTWKIDEFLAEWFYKKTAFFIRKKLYIETPKCRVYSAHGTWTVWNFIAWLINWLKRLRVIWQNYNEIMYADWIGMRVCENLRYALLK